MAGLVTTLRTGVPLKASDHFAGPWRELRVEELAPGPGRTLKADDHEAVLYVISGHGTAEAGGERLPLDAGVALTLGRGSTVTLTAEQPVRYFIARLDLKDDHDD